MAVTTSIYTLVAALCALTSASLAAPIQDSVSTTAPRIKVGLEVNPARDQGYSGSDTGITPSVLPDDIARRFPGYTLYWDLGNQLGNNYAITGQPSSGTQFLGNRNREMYEVRVLRRGPGSDLQEITSGVLTTDGNSCELPIDMDLGGAGKNHLQKAPATLSLRVNQQNYQPAIYAGSRLKVEVNGSTLLSSSKLVVNLNNITTTTVGKTQGITLRLEPFDAAIPPRNISGKLGDVLDLGAAKLVVESVADDLSEITLAVVQGDLKQAESYQAKLVSNLPPMAQVELFTRRLVTGDDLLATASKSAGVLMIFGDFKEDPMPGFFPGNQGKSATLQMSESAILETIRSSTAGSQMPQVVFVARQLALRKLYEEYLSKQPPFMVLSDYSDALKTSFRGPRTGGPEYYSYPGQDSTQKSTLRDSMGLPEGRVSVILLDRSGKVVYSKTDAGDDLRTPLVEACRLLGTNR